MRGGAASRVSTKKVGFAQLSSEAEIVPARRAKEVDESFEAALEEFGFRLIREIGRGAFSQVFLATQNDLADRYVVLKVIDKALSEPQNMAMLQHTNIVPIYSFERILSRSVICMPYAGQVTLADFLKGEDQASSRVGQSLITTVLNRVRDTVSDVTELPAGVARSATIPAADDNAVLKPLERLRSLSCNQLALWLFQRLAAALAHSHARGVLHGDLKPANVLIRNDGEPALLDFNLSQTLDHEHVRHAGGTLPYMSPEMFRGLMGQAVKPHAASDIYSMGVMLYQFVTGRMPWAGPPSSAAIDIEPAIEQRRQPIVWQAGDDVSPGTRGIIERCLHFEPADRYESAEQLRRDLDRELNNEPLIAAEEPAAERVKKWFRRHPRAVSGGSVAVLLSLLIVPLVISLLVWRNRSVHLAALAMLNSFSTESSEVLSTVMVDPRRQQDDAITISMAPLEQYGIFADDGLKALESARMTPADRATYRDAIVRHLAQLAWHEMARLKATMDLEQREAVDAKLLERTDKLLSTAARYQSPGESRALTFLAAERAWLGGDQKTSSRLAAKATKMSLDSDSEQYLEAVHLMSRRNWPAASELLESLADQGTIPSAVRWTLLGRSQFSERKYEQAKLAYTQSIERAPHASRLWLLRGLCYFQLGRYAFAEEDFAKAIELEPSLVSAWLDRGIMRMAQGRFEEAVADFTTALDHSPEHIHVLLMRSRAYDKLEMDDAAARDLDAALKSENVTWQSLLRKASARQKHGDYEGALADLERARELNPSSITVLKETAGLYAGHLNRLDDAIKMLTKIESMEPTNEGAIIDRAVYHARAGQVEAAQAALRKALAPPNAPRTLYQAACVNALLPERHGRALGFLSKAIQLGYGADYFQTDADLDSLRELDGYRAIAKTIRMGHAVRSKTADKEADLEILDADGNVSPTVPQR